MLTLDSSKAVTIYRTLQRFDEEEVSLLKQFSLFNTGFSENSFRIAFGLYNRPPYFISSFMKKAEDAGVVIRDTRIYGRFLMHPLFQLALIIGFAQKPDKEGLVILENAYDEDEVEDFFNELFRFLNQKANWIFRDVYASMSEIRPLLYYFQFFEELIPVYEQFSLPLKKQLWKQYVREQVAALRPVNQEWKQRYLPTHENKITSINGNETTENTTEEDFLLDIVLPLSLEKWTEANLRNESDLSASGLLQLLNGHYPESVILFEENIKRHNRTYPESKKSLPENPLYAVAYISALISENSDKSKKKLETLLKKKELKEDNLLFPAYLMLSAICESAFTGDINRSAVYRVDSVLTALLYMLIVHTFDLQAQPVYFFDDALYLMRNDAFKLLWKEMIRYYPDLKKELTLTPQQEALLPLMPVYRKPKPWELILNKLLENPAISPKVKQESGTGPESRIIYLLTQSLEVIPVLQKTKNGEPWKGGRKISLKTFTEFTPDMTEADTRVAATI
ncbi:MAG: hypothetical protein ACRCSQ_08215 [Bacteroidales bacterium]